MYKIEDINYMVSLFCPGECTNCNIWKYDKKEIIKDELDVKTFEKIFSSRVFQDTNYFDLTAGESQLSPKYVDIVRVIAKYKPNAFIHTNISGWYPKRHFEVTKESIKYINKDKFRIDVSLDGKKENYKNIRLVKDGYSKVLETIELLKSLRINLRVTMIIYKENMLDLEWFVEFAKKNELDYFIGYARSASLLKNKEKLYQYSDEELKDIEKRLKKVSWLNKRRMPNWLWAKSIYKKEVPLFDCYMGKRAIVIDPYGNIYPCNECLEMLHMGNIKDFDGDLDKLLCSKKALKVIKMIENKTCQPCDMLCAHKIKFPWGEQSGLQ